MYREKAPDIQISVAEDAGFRGDRGDFMELAGNLLDNACKWCRQTVTVEVQGAEHAAGQRGIALVICDDGDGIPEELAEQLLERGMRLDESAPGHGIGLAVVREIAASYGGEVVISKAKLGGAQFTATLFAPPT